MKNGNIERIKKEANFVGDITSRFISESKGGLCLVSAADVVQISRSTNFIMWAVKNIEHPEESKPIPEREDKNGGNEIK